MPRGFSSKNNHTKEIILTIAQVGCFLIAATSPYFLHNIVKRYFKTTNQKGLREKARRLYDLKRKRIVNFEKLPDGSIKITLSQNGQKLLRQYKLDEMKLQRPRNWDGYWRVIIYDIPTRQRRASNAFRLKLRQLGLYQLQKSVWVSPFECSAELDFLCAIFGLNMESVIYYFKTKEIPKTKELKSFFKLA